VTAKQQLAAEVKKAEKLALALEKAAKRENRL
jgi:hypothetical protein